jgi:hypothetical protein
MQVTRARGLCRDHVSSRRRIALCNGRFVFVKPVCSSSGTNRWQKFDLAASPDCVIKMNANVFINLNDGEEIHHKSVPDR